MTSASQETAPDMQPLSMAQAAHGLPGDVSPHAVWRWCRKGVIARNGSVVRLKHRRMGGRIYTTRAWLAEFSTELAERDSEHFDDRQTSHKTPITYIKPVGRAAKARDIDAELDAEGIK